MTLIVTDTDANYSARSGHGDNLGISFDFFFFFL